MKIWEFNWIDFLIMAIIFVSTVSSIIRGFIREAFSLATWIIAAWVAISFSKNLSVMLEPYIRDHGLRVSLSFILLLMMTLIIGGLVSFLIANLVEKTGLTGTDRMLGMVFGVGRGILLVSVVLLVFKITDVAQLYVNNAYLATYFQPLQQWLIQFLPKNMTDISPTEQVTQFIYQQLTKNNQNHQVKQESVADQVLPLNVMKTVSLIDRFRGTDHLYSQQLDFRQGVASVSNWSVQVVHEDCEPSDNTAENSSAKSIQES